MTDGAIPALITLVALSAASVASVAAASRGRERRRRRAAEHEALALYRARLRAEVGKLEIRARDLRAEIAQLQTGRAALDVAIEAEDQRRDPAAALAAGALIRTHGRPNRELTRRLERAGDAQIIPFPFLATRD